MKRFILSVVAVFVGMGLFANESTLINRKVAIIPFFNSSDNQQYANLSNDIPDTLRAFIRQTELFDIIDNNLTISKLKKADIKIDGMIWEENANRISDILEVDVVVFGFYTISNKQVTIYLNALDTSVRRSVINLEKKASTGVTLISDLESISLLMAEEMGEKLPPYEKTLGKARKNLNKNQTLSNGLAIAGSVTVPLFSLFTIGTNLGIGIYISSDFNYSTLENNLSTASMILSFFPIFGEAFSLISSIVLYEDRGYYWNIFEDEGFSLREPLYYLALVYQTTLLICNIGAVALLISGIIGKAIHGKSPKVSFEMSPVGFAESIYAGLRIKL